MTEIHKQYRQAQTPKELYTERIAVLTEEIRQLNKHNRLVVVLELSAIGLAIGCVVAYTMWSNVAALVVAALFIAAYVAIRRRDSRNSRRSDEKESLRSVYQKELNYLDGDFSGFASGEQYVNPRHEFMRVSLFSLFSSMRTTDDLAHGISYFNAELLRLQQLIETCRQNRHTLIILDEILKGTNSLDKLNGSRLFLQSVTSLPITGIIATHDLELSKMQEEYPSRFHNYCFEIQLSDEITYTYRLSEGVARNQNATYLLKNILKSALR